MITDIDAPDVVVDVRKAFEDYNAALERGDVAALNSFFWNSPTTVRFGVTEQLFGFAEIEAYRSGGWKPTGARVLERLAVIGLGRDVAVTKALYRGANGRLSRQSQTWARMPEGWRIVAAHVSLEPLGSAAS